MFEALDRVLVAPAPRGRGAWHVRVWVRPDRDGADVAGAESRACPVVLMVCRGPASYTGEDTAELCVPGNPHLARRVLDALLACDGVRAAEGGEFTARAYLHGRVSLDQAEGVSLMVGAASDAELAVGRELMEGRAGARYRAWGEEIATLLALVEAGIDFADQEGVVAIGVDALRARVGAVRAAIVGAAGAARSAARGRARVVLAGRSNAGKSTLFNALLGRRRVVASAVAGSTRDAIVEEFDLAPHRAGIVELVDLAGLDGEGQGGELAGEVQARAAGEVERADVVVWCDAGEGVGVEREAGDGGRWIRVRTKADLVGSGVEAEEGVLAVCAVDGRGLEGLKGAIGDAVAGLGSARAGTIGMVVPRHGAALRGAGEALARAAGLAASAELTAAALREALDALGELTGRTTPDEVLGRVFAAFCVGK